MSKEDKNCFGRIQDTTFNELKSLDDLINIMGTTVNGNRIIDVGEPEEFKSRLKLFREFIQNELPEFTEEEILKYDKYYHNLNKIYEWVGSYYLLTAIEYCLRSENKK